MVNTGKGLDTAPLTCVQTRALQQRLAISEVTADWHDEVMIPRRIMRPSSARDSEQLDPRCSATDI